MSPREYKRYTEELKQNGYRFLQNQPYEGRCMWAKNPDEDINSVIRIDIYHGFNAEGEEYYNVQPTIVLSRCDCECNVRLSINLLTTNIVDIESMFNKYVEKLK